MAAVGKLALGGEGGDVGKGLPDVGGPELELAHAGGVDEHGAGGGDEELAARGGVAALAVFFADLGGHLHLVAHDAVGDGGFADAGGAEQGDGAAFFEPAGKFAEAGASLGADRDDGGVAGDGGDLGGDLVGVVEQVGFVEEDDGLGAALAGDGEEALDAAEVEIGVERGDEEDGVEVGGDGLLVAVLAGGAAAETRFPREHGEDVELAGAGARARGDPVADGGQLGTRAGGVQELAAALADEFIVAGVERVGVLELADDARRAQACGGVRREGGLEVFVPAEVCEFHGDGLNRRVGRVGSEGDLGALRVVRRAIEKGGGADGAGVDARDFGGKGGGEGGADIAVGADEADLHELVGLEESLQFAGDGVGDAGLADFE